MAKVGVVLVHSLSDSQQMVHGSGKVELVCVLCLEGSQSLGGAREFRLMGGLSSVNLLTCYSKLTRKKTSRS